MTLNYADDTTFLITGNNLDEITSNATIFMNNIENWFAANNLLINHEKTNVILFRTRSKIYPSTITLNNYTYDVKSVIRLLGVAVDDCLCWSDHCRNVCSKLSGVCFAMRQLRDLVDANVLRVAYYGCCYPHLKYGISVWGGSSDLYNVFVMQKRILRVMYRLKYNESCRGLFKKHKILTVFGIYIYELVNFLIRNKDLFKDNTFTHDYTTRNRLDYCFPKHRLSMFEKSLNYLPLKCYNKLPVDIKSCNSDTLFRKKLYTLLCDLELYGLNDFFSAKL